MREIEGFDGKYLINEYGQIFSRHSNRFLAQRTINSGYKVVDLYKNNIRYQLLVHRIVAETFIENPRNYPVVNHKDFNKNNNYVNNLEWCSYKYNIDYSNCIEKANKSTSKKVKQIKNGQVINIFNSRMEAQRTTGILNTGISECCEGKRKKAGGFEWQNV